jgi:hypothetical protein
MVTDKARKASARRNLSRGHPQEKKRHGTPGAWINHHWPNATWAYSTWAYLSAHLRHNQHFYGIEAMGPERHKKTPWKGNFQGVFVFFVNKLAR